MAKLKSKAVRSIASDEELIRLKIYDGDIPLDEAGKELLEAKDRTIEHLSSNLKTVMDENARYRDRLVRYLEIIDELELPWWKRVFRKIGKK